MEEWFEREMRELRREIRRFIKEFENLFEPVFDIERGEVEPLHEVHDAGDKVIIRVDLPKAAKESVEVLRMGNRLLVRARMREPVRLCDVPFYARCEVSGYKLELELPPDANPEEITASFKAGFLEIIVPKQKVYRVKVE
ncbi:MAG: Hsp20/alpha crystallin family protein [Thermofilaceae archaeon]